MCSAKCLKKKREKVRKIKEREINIWDRDRLKNNIEKEWMKVNKKERIIHYLKVSIIGCLI